MKTRFASALFPLVAASLLSLTPSAGAQTPKPIPDAAPDDAGRSSIAYQTEQPVRARHAMVETIHHLATEAGVDITPLDLIRHDLWPAADLPPLSWTDRLTLIANEFDLTFEIVDGAHVRLAPIAGPVVVERTYPGGQQPDELAAKWRHVAPEAQIEVAQGKVVVRGRVEDHELLSQNRKPKPAPTVPGVEVHTLRVQEQPLPAVR